MKIMQGIQQVYTQRYNIRKNRSGHVFEQRYKAILCNKDEYLIELIRYIHQNPIKAGIEKDVGEYPWSSYTQYLGENSVRDTEFPLGFFSEDKKRAVALFQEFNREKNNDKCLEYEKTVRIDDKEAAQIIAEVARVKHTTQIQNFHKDKRNKLVKELKNRGLSIRQIERLTGISFNIIKRIWHTRTVPLC